MLPYFTLLAIQFCSLETSPVLCLLNSEPSSNRILTPHNLGKGHSDLRVAMFSSWLPGTSADYTFLLRPLWLPGSLVFFFLLPRAHSLCWKYEVLALGFISPLCCLSCVWVCTCMPQLEWRSENPREEIISLHHVLGSQGLNSKRQTWHQECLLAEPSPWFFVPIIPAVYHQAGFSPTCCHYGDISSSSYLGSFQLPGTTYLD